MSIKDLFGKRSNQILSSADLEKLEKDIESHEYAEEKLKDKAKFIPKATVDFKDPSTFARYGSAKKYYEDAVLSVLNTYPYDGSLKEKLEWHNKATYIDNWIFKNEYPKTTGYVSLNTDAPNNPETHNLSSQKYKKTTNPQYIEFKGGPHVDPNVEDGKLAKAWDSKSNIYDEGRKTNLYVNGTDGNTIEFWWKNDADGQYGYECIFDLWNGLSLSNDGYGRVLIEHYGKDWDAGSNSLFRLTYSINDSNVHLGAITKNIGTNTKITQNLGTTLDVSNWNHYAITFINSGADTLAKLYINGQLADTDTSDSKITTIEQQVDPSDSTIILPIVARVGAYQEQAPENGLTSGWNDPDGAIRGSIDEFRFWKKARTAEEIGRYWFTQVGGGTNTDDANIELGVYYKFNEGITNISSRDANRNWVYLDRNVLDYSGRISNGTIKNYTAAIRSIKSAIEEHDPSRTEFRDPILYSLHPLVQAMLSDFSAEGEMHDMQNNAAIYNTIPEWIRREDEEGERDELLNLTQAIASYFDTLYLQIEALPSLTNTNYIQEGEKPLPFARHLLESVGLVAPDMFVDATVMESFLGRNDERVFEDDLNNVKNLIYQNIYNNIAGIYKSKGTEKAFRNLMHCFGVGDQLIKINLYGDDATYKLEDNTKSITVKKNYINFNNPDRFDATIYQNSIIPETTSNERDYIPFTLETEVIFPKKLPIDHPNYFSTSFTTVSLFGMHETGSTPPFTYSTSDDCGFKVYAIKDPNDDSSVSFKLETTAIKRESDSAVITGANALIPKDEDDAVITYKDVYDNQKWNFAVRIKIKEAPLVDTITSTDIEYFLEFYGVSMLLDVIQEESKASVQITAASAKAALNSAKRIYAGAEKLNFTSTTTTSTDVKIGSVRYWQDYLDNDTIKSHAKDVTNYGRLDPYKTAYFSQSEIAPLQVPQSETLALHWNFESSGVTSTSGNNPVGEIAVDDVSFVDNPAHPDDTSTSVLELTERYDFLGPILKAEYTGKGIGFLAEPVLDIKAVERNYIFTAKQQLPEILNSSDTITILTEEDEVFTRESRPINHFWAIEKSMYQTISEEIINIFGTITSFNNLIGEPVNRYRTSYKRLEKLKQLFFEGVIETANIERYIEFYKWIDSAIGNIIQELIPATANVSEELRTVIESHILERNKYQTKFPTLDSVRNDGRKAGSVIYETSVSGTGESNNNWALYYSTITGGGSTAQTFSARIAAHVPGHPENTSDVLSNLIQASSEQELNNLYNFSVDTVSQFETNMNSLSIENISPFPSFSAAFPATSADENPTSVVNKTLGNYRNIYDIVQTSGRSVNNRWFVKKQGHSVSDLISIPSTSVLGHYDFVFPDRAEFGKAKHVIVERFSAPGSSYSMPLGMLDIEAEEFSSYNSLNFRNLDVRRYLTKWLTEHYETEEVSYEDIAGISVYVPKTEISSGGFHKVPRNTTYSRQEAESSSSGSSQVASSHTSGNTEYTIEKKYDNFWKQNQIPARGHQYHWINSSVQEIAGLQGFAGSYTNVSAQYPAIDVNPSSANYGKAMGDVPTQGRTSYRDTHSHTYIVDENGDGITSTDDGHYHDVVSWKISEICKTNCTTTITDCSFSLGTPSCECVTGSGGSGQSIKGDETWQ